MYNGVGVPTTRGTATSGYVQKNLSALTGTKVRRDYDPEQDILKAEARINRKPNLELLEHEYKRAVELKCLEYEERLVGKGYGERKIEKRVKKYRKRLARKLEKKKTTRFLDDKIDPRNTHTRTVVAKEGRDRLRKALGIHSSFVDGTSMAMKERKKKKKDEAEDEPAPTRH